MTAWFIDGSYAYKTIMRMANIEVDYRRMRTALEEELGEPILDAHYFSTPSQRGDGHRLFLEYLQRKQPAGPGITPHIYSLKTTKMYWPKGLWDQADKPLKVEHPTRRGVFYEWTRQKGVDVGICHNLWLSYQSLAWKRLVFFAGDRDFEEPLEYFVNEKGVKLWVIGTPLTIASGLATLAERVIHVDRPEWRDRIRRQETK
jgi:uncharacterized LabA/DUF88 family protein